MEAIIMKMQEIVNEPGRGSWCQRDFTLYDKPAIEDRKGEFFWMVRKNGTGLVHLEGLLNPKTYALSSYRMQLFRDIMFPLQGLKWHSETDKEAHFYHYDGNALNKVEYQEIEQKYLQTTQPLYNKLKAMYHEEYRQCGLPLEIVYASQGTYDRMAECLEYAYSINDSTLFNAIERLSRYPRLSLDHKVFIYTDFADKSFTFQEMLGDTPRINGGIIFTKSDKQSYWSIHT